MSTEAAVELHHHDAIETDVFGFWLYILTDVILFGSLFATFVVLNSPGYYGPTLKEHVNLYVVLLETFFLLASNFTFGLSMINMKSKQLGRVRLWLIITFILGFAFVALELYEFIELYHHGYTWYISGAASSFFTLVATHGLHVTVGLLWIIIILFQLSVFKLSAMMEKRMVMLGFFWNFLDIVWIFVFTTVYLLGAL